MKEKELRDAAICALCKQPFGHTGLPLFWRARIRRYGVKVDAASRQQGLTMMLGGHSLLAQIMGPDEDMAEQISEVEFTVCEKCAVDKRLPLMVMAEMANKE